MRVTRAMKQFLNPTLWDELYFTVASAGCCITMAAMAVAILPLINTASGIVSMFISLISLVGCAGVTLEQIGKVRAAWRGERPEHHA